MKKLALVMAMFFACVSTASAAVDTSMLQQWTPNTPAAMDAADPVALAYLAKGWLAAGNKTEAMTIANAIASRGDMAFTAGTLPSLARGGFNPSSTIYTIALVQVADLYRMLDMKPELAEALRVLEQIPTVDDGGCYAYDVLDVSVGCIQDIGGITLGVVSNVPGFDYSHLLAYESATMQPNGSYIEFQDSTIGGGQTEDAAHLAWTAFMLLSSQDPKVNDLGLAAARFVSATYDPSTAPPFAIYAVAGVRLLSGLPGGCELAYRLPAWADSYHQVDPDGSVSVKNQMWAAYVYTLASRQCVTTIPRSATPS